METRTTTTAAERHDGISRGPVEAIVYGRASKDRTKRERSIGDQIEDCRTWCAQQGWSVAHVIKDADRSASQWRTREREGWEEALELIRSGKYGALVSWEPSRAGRDLAIYVQLRAAFQQYGVLYMTHGRVYDLDRSDDAFMMGFEFLRAEADANTMRERQLRTSRLRAQKGKPHGRLPYGYRRVYDEKTRELIRQEPDPHTGQIVRDIAEQVLAGASLNSIAMGLEKAGEPLPQGPRKENTAGWVPSTVRQLLKNPTIAGKRVYRGEVIGDAAWEPLISWEDFQRIQSILNDPGRRVHFGQNQPKSLLSHIAKCHYCGRTLKRSVQRYGDPGTPAPSRRYTCKYPGCYKVVIVQAPADALVEETLLNLLTTPETLARLTGDTADGEASWTQRMEAAQQELAELQARLDDASDRYAAGELPLEVLTRIEQTLRPQIDAARKAMIPPVTDPGLRQLLSGEDVRASWQSLPVREKRRIIKAVLDVRVTSATKGWNFFDPTRVIINLRY
ncbi:recombinase family protein [Auritidibacter sp. NML100628]|uniref:recombinase family protein n=1 Tax=Auritidibacter sp. NML100628 TaxID=2170742 RepID=UPI000D72F77F|nr:recombinase family protein [Auritidibacter sp. NML100628]PXA76860.1 recombinase family protein [Auritidibacter sp. NML100628]